MKWVSWKPWSGVVGEVLEGHLRPEYKRIGVDITELFDVIDDHWLAALWGGAFGSS